MTEILEAMTRPQTNGEAPLPRRTGPKGLLPSTWLERTVKLEYVDCFGVGAETTGTLLDVYPFGPVLNLAGQRTVLAWDSLRSVTLIND